jgi:hypothetical protein
MAAALAHHLETEAVQQSLEVGKPDDAPLLEDGTPCLGWLPERKLAMDA